ncbi:MAG TPA: nickel ABC transporter permease [Candidatus Limnocylindria bacterium]|jgi:peptide/nickel transport system permease protein|nr:nickel ABC transporter permease [Candidatus Limnocylindria bacterium]
MVGYVARRALQIIPVVIGISVITWLMMSLAPGDAAEIYARQFAENERPTPADIERARKELALEGHPIEQYLRWAGRAVHGDLGRSFRSGRYVVREIMIYLPATLQLTASGALVILVIGLPMGVVAALYHNRWPDVLARFFALLGVGLPSFWLALLLIWLFAVQLQWLPSVGRGDWRNLILPALALGIVGSGSYTRLLRATMLDALSQEYITAARARGVGPAGVVIRHALRNALIPVVTKFGLTFGALLSGAVFVETIFSWPGVGKFAVDSISAKDYPSVQGFVLFASLTYVAANFLIDVVYPLIDPRIGSRARASA